MAQAKCLRCKVTQYVCAIVEAEISSVKSFSGSLWLNLSVMKFKVTNKSILLLNLKLAQSNYFQVHCASI